MTTDIGPQVDEDAWDTAGQGVDPRAVRALRSTGVRIEHLARAARFLDIDGFATVEDLKAQAGWLRDDLPALFEPTGAGGVAAGASGEKTTLTLQERGRAKAAELGWITTTKET